MQRWCWHNWSKWRTYQWTGTVYGSAGYLITGDVAPRAVSRTNQSRICYKCGKESHRRVAEADGSLHVEADAAKCPQAQAALGQK